MDSLGPDGLEVGIVAREKAHIPVCGSERHAARLGRIKGSKSLGYVAHGIRVIELFPKNNHFVRDFIPGRLRGRMSPAGFAAGLAHKQAGQDD